MNNKKVIDIQKTEYWVDGKPYTTKIERYSDGSVWRTEYAYHDLQWSPSPFDILGDCEPDAPTP